MNYSVGIWAHAQVPCGVIYRWEADGGENGTGFVLLEPESRIVRPCDGNGNAIGDLVLDADGGDVTGEAPGIGRAAFARTAAAILKPFLKTGELPQTAHTYFG